MSRTRNRLIFATLCGLLAAGWAIRNQLSHTTNTLVLYCAHDAAYADPIIRQFEQQTGITVDVRYDEEANKSLGLTNLLLAEKQQPRCDVFWNNQTLGTIRLQTAGVLQPYHSPSADRIPANFKDEDGHWTGFAARLRVYLVNTDLMEATEDEVQSRLAADSLNRVAIAVPMFGTTLSHYSVLMAAWGENRLKTWHADLHARGIREVRGNSMSKDLVAEGVCDLGYTDTDDAFVAIDAGKPVAMLPVRLDNGQTICLPNSVALIKGCRHPGRATAFIDYVLSAEVELSLANSAARQIPLGIIDESRLSPQVMELRTWAADGVSLTEAALVNQNVLDWLSAEHAAQ
ncbi:MAG: substrate-binding domain-containing protein [Planctomycetaceae bacterium]